MDFMFGSSGIIRPVKRLPSGAKKETRPRQGWSAWNVMADKMILAWIRK
jgi:hypothetical protein